MFSGNPERVSASPLTMRYEARPIDPKDSPAAAAEVRALWVLLAAGLFLLAASALSGGEPGQTASRTDRFQPTLAAGTTVHVENVNGDVVASRGAAFSAVVTTTVTAPNRSRAEEVLGRTKVLESNGPGEYRLETEWPEVSGPHARERRHPGPGCRDCRIISRYELTLPPGISASLQTVNGDVQVREVDGNLEAPERQRERRGAGARGVRSTAQTVNGRVDAAAAAAAGGRELEARDRQRSGPRDPAEGREVRLERLDARGHHRFDLPPAADARGLRVGEPRSDASRRDPASPRPGGRAVRRRRRESRGHRGDQARDRGVHARGGSRGPPPRENRPRDPDRAPRAPLRGEGRRAAGRASTRAP